MSNALDHEKIIFDILKDTTASTMMKSSEIHRQSKLKLGDFSSAITTMTKNRLISRQNHNEIMANKRLTLEECVLADAHSYYMLPEGLRLLQSS